VLFGKKIIVKQQTIFVLSAKYFREREKSSQKVTTRGHIQDDVDHNVMDQRRVDEL